jgi:hypothetical protein
MDYGNPDFGYTDRPVCFTSNDPNLGFTPEKIRMFKDGILASWGAATQLNFTGWDLCPDSDDRSHLIQVASCGNCGSVTWGTSNGQFISFSFSQWEEWARWGGVHEFGHALGFWHEQARPDNVDGNWCDAFQGGSWSTEPRSSSSWAFGVFDPFSVMSYCQYKYPLVPLRPAVQPDAPYTDGYPTPVDNPSVGNLSAIDIRGAQAAYSPREYRRTLWTSESLRQTDLVVTGTPRKILRGGAWKSKDGRVALRLTTDHRLGVFRTDLPNLPPFWATRDLGASVASATFSADAVLRVLDKRNNTLWASSDATSGGGSATLSVQQDGNVVIHNANGDTVWQTLTQHRDELEGAVGLMPNEVLDANDGAHNSKITASGQYQLIMQTDGNLVVYEDPSGAHTPIWASNTWLSGATTAKMTLDGALILSNADGELIWSSPWPNRPAAFLAMREDGNLVAYEPAKYIAWSSTTPGSGSENMGQNPPGFDATRVILWNGETLSTRGVDIFSGPGGTASLALDSYSGNAVVSRWYQDVEYVGGGQWEDVWAAYWSWSTYVPETMSDTSLRLTNDGDLQLIDGNGQLRWSSNTPGYRNTFLGLNDQGVLSIYRVISLGAQGIGFLY